MYAIIRDRGRQFTVRENETLDIDLKAGVGDSIEFDEVLLVGEGDSVKVGTPTVEGAKVSAKVVAAEVKGKKIEVMRFRRRQGSQTKTGHRTKYTRIQIEKIEG